MQRGAPPDRGRQSQSAGVTFFNLGSFWEVLRFRLIREKESRDCNLCK
jgi:hypothetical protein